MAVSPPLPVQSKLDSRLRITTRARRVLRRLCVDQGDQHVIVTWPAGATTIPAAMHQPGRHEVIIGHVARCPIYVDVRQLGAYRNRQLVMDIPDSTSPPRRPVFRVQS